ncbi:MAG: ABC transporter ATP-binding protein [Candidatus Rokubacteria bacterium]|nr:ABC transporter ATP-binding protein [Candidatus Rokubacteria bacterium]
MAGGKFVDVAEVSRRFRTPLGDIAALEAVSFDVRAGEFVSIVGPSGCGKSTLVMLLAGLLAPTSGAVSIGGLVVDRPQTNLGIVFQSPVLLAWRSALDNVLLQLEMRGIPTAPHRERARTLLGSVGLDGFEHRYPHELSGGMRQRVSICRALIHDPPLLVMDEPFGALDALTRDQITLDIQRIWARGQKTVVFITHSITEAVFLSDRVLVMTPRPGRVDTLIEVDLPRPRRLAVREDPRFAAYTRQIHDRFLARGVLRDIEGVA